MSGLDLRDAFQKAKEQALEEPKPPLALQAKADEADPKAPRVTRQATFTVRCLAPETGEPLEALVVSVVPDGPGLEAIEREVARRSGGVPWSLKPPSSYQRALMLATVLVQCKDLPEWVWARVQEDSLFLQVVYGGLAEHQAAYFRLKGDPATGAADPRLSGMARGPLASG